jgi:hypothetical protein
VEQFGDAVVTGNYLKVTVALLALVIAGLVLLNLKTMRTFRNFKPLVIRIDELGRTQAVGYDTFAYKPEDKDGQILPDAVLPALLTATVTPSTKTSPNPCTFSTSASPTTSSLRTKRTTRHQKLSQQPFCTRDRYRCAAGRARTNG